MTRRSRSARPTGPWRPKNFDGEFHDRVGVREAIERSLNVATVRLAPAVGIAQRGRRRAAARHREPAARGAEPRARHGGGLPARARARLRDARERRCAARDTGDRGRGRSAGGVLARRELRFQRVLDAGTAYLATSLLEGVAERGTAAGVRAGGLRGPIAAKTGTTDEERDLWFMGFTPGPGRGGLDRVRRAAQRRAAPELPARCRSGAASSRRSRAAPCAARSRDPPRSSAPRSRPYGCDRALRAAPSTAPSTSCPARCRLRSAPTGTSSDAERTRTA